MKKDSWGMALRITANLSSWVAFPVIIGVFLGKWLDRRFDTEPWLFLATIGFSFLVSIYGLAINATKEFKKIEDEYKEKNNKAEVDKTAEIKKDEEKN
jgi:F0F1-type ATP synthase assembly protein I